MPAVGGRFPDDGAGVAASVDVIDRPVVFDVREFILRAMVAQKSEDAYARAVS